MSKRGFKSLVVGLLTGATLGLLFSPEKGSKVRSKLNKKARSNKQISKALDSLIELATDTFASVKKELGLKESAKQEAPTKKSKKDAS